ncbi:flagellin [Sutcliffiella horikoshii]|uniref:flagellin N-terminal helical domain-containing protein n=1 Tax=Sutcliffiella horikoshii TaxID=79883 RepID=UPI003CEB079E
MRINHNIAALNTHRQLNSATNAQAASMEKLSSGLRINKAGDDAAGLAISEKMRGQIRGLDMASKNAQDANSLIATAEGALNETHDILQRMRELSVQSANDTNTDDDRAKIQSEVDQLAKEVTRISNTTEFNTQNLLAGGLDNTYQIGANKGQNVNLMVNAMDAQSLGVAGMAVTASGATSGMEGASFSGDKGTAITDGNVLTVTVTGVSGAAQGTSGAVGGLTLTTDNNTNALNGMTLNYVDGDDGAAASAVFDKDLNQLTITGDFNDTDTNGNFTSAADLTTAVNAALAGKGITETVTISGTASAATGGETGAVASGAHGTATISVIGAEAGASAETTTVAANANSVELTGAKYGGVKLDLSDGNDLTTSSTIKVTVSGSSAATLNPDGTVAKDAVAAAGIDVSSQKSANDAIETLNNAITKVSEERSKLGAYQNRLDHTINNLNTSSENLTAAESRIRDVDYALAA